MNYQPHPLDTSHVRLDTTLQLLVERLAENNHDVWAQQRIRDGWSYGPQRDDDTKTHPDLVPYAELSEAEKEYDRNSVRSTIEAILALGFAIEKVR